MSRTVMILLLVVVTSCAATADGARSAVSPGEADAWLRWTLPLPRQIEITQRVVLAPEDVGIRLRRDAGPAERTAAAQLDALFVERAGVEPRGYLREATLRAVRNPGTVTLARDFKSSES